tara:strand:+ start:4298 stop:4648 length:351 start_codon:yes stop_codon:yes gene_type:complete
MSEPVFTHTTEESMVMENSFGTVRGPEKLVMVTRIWMWNRDGTDRGSFTWGAADGLGAEHWYAEGGLWFDDQGYLTDFDGVYDLPPAAIKWLYDEGRLTQWYIDMWVQSGRLEVSE